MTIPARLRTVMSATFGVPEATLSAESSPDTIPTWDSVHHLHLIVALEAEFGVTFDPEQAVELTTVSALEAALSELGAR